MEDSSTYAPSNQQDKDKNLVCVYVDRVKHIYLRFSDVYNELKWITEEFTAIPEVLIMEDYEKVRDEKLKAQRDHSHPLHIYTADCVYHLQHFTSGYMGGSTRCLRELLRHLSIDLTMDFLSGHSSFSLDFNQMILSAGDEQFPLMSKIHEPNLFELVYKIEVFVGYENLKKLVQYENEQITTAREVIERGIKKLKPLKE